MSNGDTKMKKLLIGAAALAAMAAPAFAADMPPRPYTKAPAYTAPQVVYNWTGFYIGGHVGGAFAGSIRIAAIFADVPTRCFPPDPAFS